MNPRVFCRERSYQRALLLTYSFDPIFFEQMVLPDLWAGQSSDILVVADQAQIDASMHAAAGQLWHLGRNYLLAGANHSGAFHPKLFLRLGAKDGLVMLGSGNVTSSGWGGNQELGAAWMVGPQHADKGGWLHPLLDGVLAWCGGELEKDAVRRMKDAPWLSQTSATHAMDGAVLHSRIGSSLGYTLAQRWAGRQFDDVKILTGSTDESGAFLRWAHSTFGLKRATVALTPASASFICEKLADLPLELSIIPLVAERPMHAKFYWFDGPEGPAAVMGSANCSAAAWLLPPDRGGNIETLVAYDQPKADDFEVVLNVFLAPLHDPVDVFLQKSSNLIEQDGNGLAFQLRSLQWDAALRRLQADIYPVPQDGMIVELLLGGLRVKMQDVKDAGRYWTCQLPDNLEPATVFALVAITRGDECWQTLPRWVNDVAALEHASHSARLLEPFKGLEREASSKEQRQMLDELQEVAHALFNDAASFRDPGAGSGRVDKANEVAPAAPVNPADLIVHLDEAQQTLPAFHSATLGTLSLTGILRLLFDVDTDGEAGSSAAEDEESDEGQPPHRADKRSSSAHSGNAVDNSQAVPVEDRFRQQLATQINTFLAEMSTSTFAERCSATQMVQAVSFPLAVALRGQRRGWVTAESAEKWALDVFAILFRGTRTGTNALLHVVEQRYAKNEQQTIFDEVVGDGTLWVVLVATLGNASWSGVGTDIDKAVALREVYMAPQLLASAVPARIATLIGKVRVEGARSYIAEVAPRVTQLLNEVEDALGLIWEGELLRQGELGITHKVGDLLWRDKVGWAVCLAEAQARTGQAVHVRLRGIDKDVAFGFYVNVSNLAAQAPQIGDLIARLRLEVSTMGSIS